MKSTDKTLSAFICVFASSALWPNLPEISLVFAIIIVFVIIRIIYVSAVLNGALLGFIWATSMGYWYSTWQLDEGLFNQNVIIEGRVASVISFKAPEDEDPNKKAINKTNAEGNQQADGFNQIQTLQFNFTLNQVGKYPSLAKPKVRLSWYGAQFVPKQGQRLRLLVNLKAPNGLANPHTFHYQTWLASQNIVATAYVIDSPSNAVLDANVSLRQKSIDTLAKLPLSKLPWLQALSFGHRADFTEDDWELLQLSGTAHLFAISGLHVSIVFAYCLFLLSKPLTILCAFAGLPQYHLHKLCALAAGLMCLLYAYLAGFQVPVLRAVLALALWVYLTATGTYWRMPSVLLFLLSAFFILFPFSILSISFWFSFIAVLSIWVFVWRYGATAKPSFLHKLKLTFYLQVWLSLITLPLTLYIFDQLPIFALIANLILVPWVSIVIVPLCVLASSAMLVSMYFDVSGLLHAHLFTWANSAMEASLWLMQKTVLASHVIDLPDLHFDTGSLFLIGLLVLLFVLPFWPLKKVLVSCVVITFFAKAYAQGPDEASLLIFDVGQGSASLLRFSDENEQAQAWLFDTGASFRSGFSMVEAVILPYLKEQGISRINVLLLSHFDNDHAGGVNVLSAAMNIEQVITPQHRCNQAGSAELELGAVNLGIEILWPLLPVSGELNAHSCVIRLNVGNTSILFAGDIERAQEDELLHLHRGTSKLKADILIAPHHGSRTSSTKEFVKAVSPSYVVFTAAQPNRWQFPHPEVVANYQEVGSEILQTGKHGFIEFSFQDNHIQQRSYRQNIYNRWYFKAAN